MRERLREFQNPTQDEALWRVSRGERYGYLSPVQRLTRLYEEKLQRKQSMWDRRREKHKQQKLGNSNIPDLKL